MDVRLLCVVVCCQVEVSATGWSLVQRSSTDGGVSCVWSWNLKNEEAQTRKGCKRQVEEEEQQQQQSRKKKTGVPGTTKTTNPRPLLLPEILHLPYRQC
jgi:hypothetical protein